MKGLLGCGPAFLERKDVMFDVHAVRKNFPSLKQTQEGRQVIFFDNPGGTWDRR